MARAVLSNVLETSLREMTDTVNDTHLSKTYMYGVLTAAVADTWDKILKCSKGDHFTKSVTFSTVAGQTEYPLSTVVSAGDFYKVSVLAVDEGQGQFRPLTSISPLELQSYRAPTAAVPMKLHYTPCAPVWTVGNESFDGINGWEEHTLNTAAVMVKKKKQDDFQPFLQAKKEMEGRMASAASRDDGEPPRVVRKHMRASADYYAAFRNNVSKYLVRGLNLELYYNHGYIS